MALIENISRVIYGILLIIMATLNTANADECIRNQWVGKNNDAPPLSTASITYLWSGLQKIVYSVCNLNEKNTQWFFWSDVKLTADELPPRACIDHEIYVGRERCQLTSTNVYYSYAKTFNTPVYLPISDISTANYQESFFTKILGRILPVGKDEPISKDIFYLPAEISVVQRIDGNLTELRLWVSEQTKIAIGFPDTAHEEVEVIIGQKINNGYLSDILTTRRDKAIEQYKDYYFILIQPDYVSNDELSELKIQYPSKWINNNGLQILSLSNELDRFIGFRTKL